ncbi:hypothetical protein NOK12_03210 [Nocardioides sp. OK12]|uniref:PDGLE domain-containing protein n=1 Tax=Nocardioides sp. OK12 TaxID=2758661 RepID=UPI0021C2EA8F|nr:PDGLE domain-containing protein [Nocardioides sp. OK12]GHJ57802.1 hypothetical protein NOK12_03210 [Nocardioides sp. OK12]
MSARTAQGVSTRAVVVGALLVSLLLAGVVSFYAASTPDGLTKVSQEQGFAETETEHGAAEGPFAGYDAGFLDGDRLSGGVAGVAGVLVVLVLGTALAYGVRRHSDASTDAGTDAGAPRDQTQV